MIYSKHIKTALLIGFGLAQSSLSLGQQNFNLGSELAGASPQQTTNGCLFSTCSSYCSSNGTGNHAATQCTGVLTIPANQYTTVSITSNMCASPSGLDAGDNVTINGSNLPQAPFSGDEPVSYTGCFYNPNNVPVDINVVLTVNRRDETVNVSTTSSSADPGGCTALALLPVELAGFSADRIGGETILRWQTASELNNSHFAIEKSFDGTTFFQVGTVKGKPNAVQTNEYHFRDWSQNANGSNYYRLKQVDFDGSFSYSNIVEVHVLAAETAALVYPTVATDRLHLSFTKDVTEDGNLLIINQMGQVLLLHNYEAGAAKIELPINELPNGHYYIKIVSETKRETFRFVKQ